MVSKRFRNSIRKVKTFPGADVHSDHNPVVARIRIRPKALKKMKGVEHFDLNKLKEEDIRCRFNIELVNRYNTLNTEETEQCPDNKSASPEDKIDSEWNILKLGIQESVKAVISKNKKIKKTNWMTHDILNLMEERKKWKFKNQIKYAALHKQITAKCRKAKDRWLKGQCHEIEQLEKDFKIKEMHVKIKELSGNYNKVVVNSCIKDKDGNILFDEPSITNRWGEYVKDLYDDDRPQIPDNDMESGQYITEAEIGWAIHSLKHGKAPGPDDIYAEALKALDEHNLKELTKLCNLIYDCGHWPDDLKHSTFITIPKKPKAQDCTEFRTISLMSHVTKVLLKVIQSRIRQKVEQEISEVQSGFRPGVGTREGIFNLRSICERSLEIQKDVFICFIDYSKAFDNVKHHIIIDCLKEIGVDDKDINIISRLYWEQSATVKTKGGMTNKFDVKKGVRQGCVLSPCLFNLYTEKIFREIDNVKGVNVGGVNINNLRYADDTVLLAENAIDLQNLLTILNEKGKSFGMRINIAKTKTMLVSKTEGGPKIKITIDGIQLEQVEKMVYLGQMFTDDSRSEVEIKRRIGIARGAFEKLASSLTSRNLSINTRIRLARCYVWSSLLYGVETWTISNSSLQRIEAFEMWMLRRMLNISWSERKSNKEVLALSNSKRTLLSTVKGRKLRYFGHLIRRDGLQRLLLEGKFNGRRGRGRPRATWADNIKDWTHLSYTECVRNAQCRETWRSMIVNLLRAEDTHR